MKNLRLTTKGVVALMASTLLLGGAIGGTMAWLTAESGTVTNTFTVGDIGDLGLTEPNKQDEFKVIPSVNITKDPKVTYTAESTDVPAYIFVQMTFEDQTDWSTDDNRTFKAGTANNVSASGLSFSIANGWTHVTGTNYVYYKEWDSTADNLSADSVIADDKIDVSENITKAELSGDTYDALDITFKAYAIQKANGNDTNDGEFTAAEAWATVNPTTTTP